MPTYRIQQVGAAPAVVEGRKFAFYVASVRFWFIAHQSGSVLRVSHLDSGMRVLDVQHSTLAACLADRVSACKLELQHLVDRVGAERIRSVLAGAPDLPPK